MTTERLTFDVQPGGTFADTASRRIRGLAIPAGAKASKGGRTWVFARDSVRFGQRTPLLAHHDVNKPVGLLTAGQWTDRGLEVEFQVSRTTAGDEVLQLANDGVLALSVGIDVPAGGSRLVGEELHVSEAFAAEVSLVSIPAFAGSVIDSVALSGESGRTTAMPDAPEVVTTPAPAIDVNALGAAIGAAFAASQPGQPTEPTQPTNPTQPQEPGPQPQPVPQTRLSVAEESPYRFDGTGGKFGFVADAYDAFHGSGEANQRLTKFLHETFVTQANVATLNPVQNRPDMYVGALRYGNRPLANAITTGTIADSTPFVIPKFSSSGTLVAPHVEGTEPSLATFTATSQTITPGALSGKAEITREVWDARGNPQVDAMVWQEMLNASVEAAEARIAALLDGLTPTAIPVVGVDDAAVDDLTAALVALQYEKGGNRFNSLVLASNLYTALAAAKDGDGRKLLPVINPQNADGSMANNFGALNIGNVTGYPAWGLGTSSYLLVKSSVFQWLSPPQKLTFDIQVKSIYLGLFQYSAEAVTRNADVREITYAAS